MRDPGPQGRRPDPPAAGRRAGPARRAASTTSSRRASAGSSGDNPLRRDLSRHPHRGPPAGRRDPRRASSASCADGAAHLAAVEALDPAGLSPDGAVRARPRDPQRPAPDLRHRGRPDLGAPLDRARRRSATRCSCCSRATSRRCPSGSTRSRAGSRRCRRSSTQSRTRAVVPQVRRWQQLEIESAADLPSFFDEIVGRRSRRCRTPSGAAWTRPRPTARAAIAEYGTWLQGVPRRRDRRLGAGPRALRRARRACAPSTASTPTRSWRSARSSSRRNKAARIRAAAEIDDHVDEADRHRPPQVGPPGDVRGGARRLSRRDGPRAPAPHRPRHRDRPAGRADRGHRDARVPAQRHPVRRLLLAAEVRPEPEGHLHRHAVGRRRPERDARAQLQLDQQHEHPRGVPGPPPPAGRRERPPVADPAAHRRPGVRRGLGDVLRADDARAGLRRRRRTSG